MVVDDKVNRISVSMHYFKSIVERAISYLQMVQLVKMKITSSEADSCFSFFSSLI